MNRIMMGRIVLCVMLVLLIVGCQVQQDAVSDASGSTPPSDATLLQQYPDDLGTALQELEEVDSLDEK